MRTCIVFIFFMLPLVVLARVNNTLDPFKWVNPFIGTAQSLYPSKWEGHGRTYPGAVAPFGYIQLSPETRLHGSKGYDYEDSVIYYFSCIHHASGYPSGSSGGIHIMPLHLSDSFEIYHSAKKFSHANEKARPGFYEVLFDDQTRVEVSAKERSGIFRFSFADEHKPAVFIGGTGDLVQTGPNQFKGSEHHAFFEFNVNSQNIIPHHDGLIVCFEHFDVPIILKISTSRVNHDNALLNLQTEMPAWDFGEYSQQTLQQWNDELSVIQVNDENEENLIKFYTALYHSKLIPWIISDVNGEYKGADGQIHVTKGKAEYSLFSPWDTFRSLHPLQTLIDPNRHTDMLLSICNVYLQSGRLPKGPMTGNHIIAVITDAIRKGISHSQFDILYDAMKKIIYEKPLIQIPLQLYDSLGYVPYSYPESVTHTVEFAYNDWVLAQYALFQQNDTATYDKLFSRSFNYRNLFHVPSLFLLPRLGDDFMTSPGNRGYKEGDQWIYSFFVPHNIPDLINLMGGNKLFTDLLDEGFENNHFVFDNEPVFHIPYLYNYAGNAHKTQKTVRMIMDERFGSGPDGLPGNDDLGSLSSWFVFSALGFYPVCPGMPYYDIGSPLFNEATIHLPGNKQWVIQTFRSEPDACCIKSIRINDYEYSETQIKHDQIFNGGSITFDMTNQCGTTTLQSKAHQKQDIDKPIFIISDVKSNLRRVKAHQEFFIRFSLRNTGGSGTHNLRITDGEEIISQKNIFLNGGEARIDSVSCRLYTRGNHTLSVSDTGLLTIKVQKQKEPIHFILSKLNYKPVLYQLTQQRITFQVMNPGSRERKMSIPVNINGSLSHVIEVLLAPGEKKLIENAFAVGNEGIYQLYIGDQLTGIYKVYKNASDATLFEFHTAKENIDNSRLTDHSGLNNHGKFYGNRLDAENEQFIFNQENYFELLSSSYDADTFSLMLWVYPFQNSEHLVSLISCGDQHVLQYHARHKTLSFFTGGWGRGEVTVSLPEKWENKWHHITAVYEGGEIRLYLNGVMEGKRDQKPRALREPNLPWLLGRNSEFPGRRIFHGKMDFIRRFESALSAEEINQLYESEMVLIE
ncbi:MAG: GH92 family glycosyl hydrolase [Cyclobacteriaceae bacterium]|nr:GH92 family glycosyl hydrolase [Cyclobacteriaceae bacterium]